MARKRSNSKRLFMTGLIVCSTVVLGIIFTTQVVRLERLKSEAAALESELHGLKIEEQKLEYLTSYIRGESFARDYAKGELGFIAPFEVVLEDR